MLMNSPLAQLKERFGNRKLMMEQATNAANQPRGPLRRLQALVSRVFETMAAIAMPYEEACR